MGETILDKTVDSATTDDWYAGAVYDALHEAGVPDNECVLPKKLKPLDPREQCYGPVLLCGGCVYSGGASKDGRFEVYDAIQPGAIVVLEVGRWPVAVAYAGDVGLLVCQQAGAAGFVTDGYIRDARRIWQRQFPCFCRGVTPVDAAGWWEWSGLRDNAIVGGVRFDRGDWIFGDGDGLLRVPADQRIKVERLVWQNLDRERNIRLMIGHARRDQAAQVAREAYEHFGRW